VVWWAGEPVGRWAGGPVGRWAGRSVGWLTSSPFIFSLIHSLLVRA